VRLTPPEMAVTSLFTEDDPRHTARMTGSGRWRWPRRRWRTDSVVLVGLSIFVTVVYVLVVLGGGVLVGHTSSPDIGLSVLATAIVALSFEPLRSRLEATALRLFRAERTSPYETLSQFVEAATGPSAEDRMAQVLAEGTGAQWAQVWLAVRESLVLAAAWPPEAADTDHTPPGPHEPPGRRIQTVRRGDEILAVLRLQERDGQQLTPVEERLFANLAVQAGPLLHGARLRAQLSQRWQEMSARAEELRKSRERVVDAHDAERRHLERDIHDGAQQHLVAVAVNLRLAETVATRSPERAATVLHEQIAATRVAVETLTSLSTGIYPPLLSAHGLATALRSAASASPIPVTVIAASGGRYPAPVEAAVYFCCLEAIQNATKHSGASEIAVRVATITGRLEFTVEDDGRGFDAASVTSGTGLANMRDRVDTAGGGLIVASGPQGATRVSAWVPIAPAAVDLAVNDAKVD
jgi:signal transduction histidine kinase